MNKTLSLFIPAAALCFAGCAGQMATWENDSTACFWTEAKPRCACPSTACNVTYADNTKSVPDTLFNDSFFVQAVNGLLSFEVSQNFTMCRSRPDHAGFPCCLQARRLFHARQRHREPAFYFASRAGAGQKHNADIVIVPYSCEIRHVTIRPWAGAVTGSGHPTNAPFPIWQKQVPRAGMGQNRTHHLRAHRKKRHGQAHFVFVLKREKKPDQDIVKIRKTVLCAAAGEVAVQFH